jgi:hypothetical protein
MKRLFLVCLAFAAVSARADGGGKLGAGVILGVPFGATAKYWVDDRHAVQTALGVSDGDLTVSADVLRNFNDLLPRKRPGRLPVYVGLGLKYKAERRTFVGLRFVGGISFFQTKKSLEFFAEMAPVLRLAPNEGAAFDGGVGVRRYF